MARVDKFIQALYQYNGSQVEVAVNKRATLWAGGVERQITAQPLTDSQVEMLISEVATPQQMSSLKQTGKLEVELPSAAGPALLKVQTVEGGLRMVIQKPRAEGGSSPPGRIPTTTPPSASAPPAGRVATSTPPSAAPARPAAESRPPAAEPPKAAPPPAAPAPAPAPARPVASVAAQAGDKPIDALLRLMIAQKCSDLHLCSGNPALYRKDGDIVPLGEDRAMGPDEVKDLLYAIMPERNRVQFEELWDTDFAHEIPGLARFRCNVFMDRKGPGGVFRQIPSKILTAEDLGLSPHILALGQLHKGLVVVTGPTGSGKSTTLAALIDYINTTRPGHLITIEDPIEFVHPNKRCLVNQREIGVHTKGFKAALRAALREDPDIVLVGEMRDLETVSIAIETAETGHLVFGTLHTNTAASTIDRIIDQFPPDRQAQVRTMLSESLKGVIAQTLCKKIGGGRAAALEVLIVTPSVANLIREAKTFQIASVMQTGKNVGMVTINDALLDLVKRNVVEPREAYEKAIHKAEFKTILQRANFHIED